MARSALMLLVAIVRGRRPAFGPGGPIPEAAEQAAERGPEFIPLVANIMKQARAIRVSQVEE
jgi:hypothetical protein